MHIADRIKALMRRHGLSDAELARQIAVPQATISRILSGETKDPRISTLKGIAQVLGTTIDHLVIDATAGVPLLDWSEIRNFISAGVVDNNEHEWIPTGTPTRPRSFAVRSTPSMEPRYRDGSILIVQPTEHYRDFQVAIVAFDNESEPAVRRIIKDGSMLLLKRLNDTADVPPMAIPSSANVIGVVTEARFLE